MIVEVEPAFEKDIKKIKDKKLKQKVSAAITSMEKADSLADIKGVKKLKGSKNPAYRIRIGNYRLGFHLNKETIVLARFLDRKELYKYYP